MSSNNAAQPEENEEKLIYSGLERFDRPGFTARPVWEDKSLIISKRFSNKTPSKRVLARASTLKAFGTQKERVGVFNCTTVSGSALCRQLAKKGFDTIAVVRVKTNSHVLKLYETDGVEVRLADSRFDTEKVASAIRGCKRVFFVQDFWEKFESPLQETQALNIVDACKLAGIQQVIHYTVEDTAKLRHLGLQSQIKHSPDGSVNPSYKGMQKYLRKAEQNNLKVTHMIVSFLNAETSKQSLTMVHTPDGTMHVFPHLLETEENDTVEDGMAVIDDVIEEGEEEEEEEEQLDN
mmetsp:Transcript_14232/g.21906  ORF Transcript_14232/g.21906 Transcript_14232/m.21906 type:complete len:293 (-) Transcript_14232:164-1042(-)|eukprot:CAMPEP_0196815724 /NCGR_PEP_ID=MMETSP1362-20130617/51452_1 /TAXON_ID=163516 /ORGANISM="Leptocylindrus danicus, Strain CCMP1856" /LENGTH=292 /DNA_ID=CAMNT_0042192783 /DNA_START=62 /DNA_END=940 /DNA_ORIENTATION=-